MLLIIGSEKKYVNIINENCEHNKNLLTEHFAFVLTEPY